MTIEPQSQQATKPASKRRPFLKGILAGGLLGGLAASAIGAFAHFDGMRGPGCGWHGRHAMHDPAAIQDRAGMMADWALDKIKATDAQRAQVKSIVRETLEETLKVRAQHEQNRKAMVELLTQPNLDRAALQQLREAEVALLDQASKRVVDGIADVADVLTPAQRAQLAEMLNRWRGGGHQL